MAADILTLARETLALADGATPAPWRYGALEHGGRCVTDGRGYLFAQVDDDGNGRMIAACRTAAPELARVIALLDKLTSDEIAGVREQWKQGRPDPEAIGWGDAMVFIRQRLGLDATEGGR